MRRLVLLLGAVLLAGCASLPPPAPAVVDVAAADAAQRQRAQALGLEAGQCSQPGWAISGRVALASGKQGGSGRFEWTQGAGQVRLMLSAPLTRQSWELDVDAQGASLRGLAGGDRHGADAAQLLRAATGWEIPVAALGCWLRAVEATPAQFGPARIDYGVNMLPRRIEQAGWVVEYDGWERDPFTSLQMPARIEARRGESRIRLLVDRWGLE